MVDVGDRVRYTRNGRSLVGVVKSVRESDGQRILLIFTSGFPTPFPVLENQVEFVGNE